MVWLEANRHIKRVKLWEDMGQTVTAVSHMVSCLELDWLLTDWDGGWKKGLGVGCVSGGQVQGGATNYSDKNLF